MIRSKNNPAGGDAEAGVWGTVNRPSRFRLLVGDHHSIHGLFPGAVLETRFSRGVRDVPGAADDNFAIRDHQGEEADYTAGNCVPE
jgi:hypothetical protein